MKDRPLHRRAVLRVAAVAGAAAVTGCASRPADSDGGAGATGKSPALGGSAYGPGDDTGPADATDAARSPRKAWRYVHFGDRHGATYVTLAASAPDDVWVLGTSGAPGEEKQTEPFLERYDGRAWRTHPLPRELPSGAHDFTLAATGPDNVWLAVGTSEVVSGRITTRAPQVYRWDGAKWRTLPALPRLADSSVWPGRGDRLATAGPDHAWLCLQGSVLYWNGSTWRDTKPAFVAQSVTAAPAKGSGGAPLAWVVGMSDSEPEGGGGHYPQPATARWGDGGWQTVKSPAFRFPDPVPPEASASLEAVALAEDQRSVWALGNHSYNHGEVEEEPEDGPIVLEWDGGKWNERRLPKLSRALDARATAADGAGGLLLDSDTRLTRGGEVHKLAQPPDVAGPDGSTPTPRSGRRSGQNMRCYAACSVPGTRTVLAVGAVEFNSDTAERPRRPMIARYDAGQ
ncbi:hypothetical protein [Streptomyces iconiensis]|uniref:Galactose oxidase n=1 Tax=Streptomyces iconiensis TaxID=1384038 RepID=A0ABT6ZWX4_9ACTN|nr:hypothetical protein [Streptomyces iconiensis]MDJ1133559.1 hypothetical protein [Streptomyces iconiensis]